jgi:hypothetical protein
MVLVLDPIRPLDPNSEHGHGVFHPFTQTTDGVVVTKYTQWRDDTSEMYEVWWGQDQWDRTRGFAYAWDIDRRISVLEWLEIWNQPNYQTDDRWETVAFTYDFPNTTAAVKVADRDEVSAVWDPNEPYAPFDQAAGFGIIMWDGDLGEKWSRMRVNYLQDAHQGWLDVDALGGPVVGPDGKIYFFETEFGFPTNPGYLFAIQPKSLFPLGDMNCDAAFNGGDIDPFFLALGDPAGYEAAFPDCDIMLGDMNCDTLVNGADIDEFFRCLGIGGCTCP